MGTQNWRQTLDDRRKEGKCCNNLNIVYCATESFSSVLSQFSDFMYFLIHEKNTRVISYCDAWYVKIAQLYSLPSFKFYSVPDIRIIFTSTMSKRILWTTFVVTSAMTGFSRRNYYRAFYKHNTDCGRWNLCSTAFGIVCVCS